MKEDDPWFVYWRRPGRIRAAPASWKGWVSLLAIELAVLAVSFFAVREALKIHWTLAVAGLFLTIVAGILLIVRLAVAKGRRLEA